MAMTILNNTSAMLTLGELNKNITKVGKDLKKVATGQKMTGAGDGASEYAVSEKMRVRLRALNQDIQNVQTGSSLVKTADGAIANIVEELRSLKELAINAANDTNNDKDRATIQRDFDKKKENINEIASETNYNGKILLDGRWRRGSTESRDITETNTVAKTTSRTVTISTEEPTETIATIPAGNYTIDSDGVYTLAANYTGTVTIADGVSNVKITQENPSTALREVFIVGPSSGDANLWIEDLNILNRLAGSAIKFNGADNTLTLKGDNTISAYSRNRYYDETQYHKENALIHIGDGLTIEGDGSLTSDVDADMATPIDGSLVTGAIIGTNVGEASSANITINSGTFNLSMHAGGGACIGSGANMTVLSGLDGKYTGTITINGGTINASLDAVTYTGAAIGSGYEATVGKILIGKNANISATSTITDSDATDQYKVCGAGIGSGSVMSSRPQYADLSRVIDGICINNAASVTARSVGGVNSEDIGHGTNAAPVTVTYVDEDFWKTGADDSDTITYTETTYDTVTSVRTETTSSGGKSLAIHHGTKANQAMNIFFKDMRTKAMDLDDVSVTTRQNATDAIGKVDAAIEYALDEATNVGAYLSRLEYTAQNLTTASENTQASESTIRDTDMARAMTDYTKDNVLAQAAQSMLAQANQNGSSVLSLLQ